MRLTYVRRRVGTRAGRRETWRWGLAIGWLVLVAMLVVLLWRREWMVSEWTQVLAAWEVLAAGQVTVEVVSVVVTVAMLMCVPSVVLAARLVVRLRPWRPHSGGMNLAIPVVRLAPPAAETWRLIGQQRLLERFADVDLSPNGGAATAPGLLGETAGPSPAVGAAEMPVPAPTNADDAALPSEVSAGDEESDAPRGQLTAREPPENPGGAAAAPAAETLERLASAPDNAEVVAGGQDATRTTQATVLLPAQKEIETDGPQVRIYRLFNKNTNMREERASVILLFAMHNQPISLKEVGHVSGIASERLRSLVNRLRKEGWLERSGRGKYQLGKYAITDLGMLIGAVKAGNQEAATTVAATMQDPLPGLGSKWVNQEMWAVRRSLRAAATEVLEVARERWPENEVFVLALDNIGDQEGEGEP